MLNLKFTGKIFQVVSYTVNISKFIYRNDVKLEGDVNYRMTIIDQTRIKYKKSFINFFH